MSVVKIIIERDALYPGDDGVDEVEEMVGFISAYFNIPESKISIEW